MKDSVDETFPADGKRTRSAVIRQALAQKIVDYLKGARELEGCPSLPPPIPLPHPSQSKSGLQQSGSAGGFPYLIAGKYTQDFGAVEESCFPRILLVPSQKTVPATMPPTTTMLVATMELVTSLK